MTDTNTSPAQQNVIDAHSKEIDGIVEGGWDLVIERVQITSERFIEIAANIHAHRKPAMTVEQQRDSGLLGLSLGLLIDDFLNLIKGFRPPKRPAVRIDQPEFSSPLGSVRDDFPSPELLKRHTKAIDLGFFLTVDAVEILVKRPDMPIPTFDQLASVFIELARLESIQTVVETAASEHLSSGSSADIDLFGVGASAAKIVNQIIPPRCIPGGGRITLPEKPTVDDAIAANLLRRFVLSKSPIYCERQPSKGFEAAATHTSNHATVGVGSDPFHAPKQLCFDKRSVEQPMTNTELVVEHAIEMGTPLDFTDPLERMAAGDQLGEFQFEVDMINTFFEVCGSASLAMEAVMLLINNQFDTSDTFSAWCHRRSLTNSNLESLPGYLENLPKAEIDLSRIPKLFV